MCDQSKEYRAFNAQAVLYDTAQEIPVTDNCFTFMFTNLGDTIAWVNDMIIYPGVPGVSLGDSRTIGAHKGYLYKGRIDLRFDTVAPGVNPSVEIVQSTDEGSAKLR